MAQRPEGPGQLSPVLERVVGRYRPVIIESDALAQIFCPALGWIHQLALARGDEEMTIR